MCHWNFVRIKWQYYLGFVYGFLEIIATQTASTGIWYTFFEIFWLLSESLLLILSPLSFLWTNLFPQGSLPAAAFMKIQTLAWEKVFVSLRASSQSISFEVAFSNLDWFTIVSLRSERSNSEANPSSALFWHQLFEWIVEISCPTFTLFQSFTDRILLLFLLLQYCSCNFAASSCSDIWQSLEGWGVANIALWRNWRKACIIQLSSWWSQPQYECIWVCCAIRIVVLNAFFTTLLSLLWSRLELQGLVDYLKLSGLFSLFWSIT